MSTNGETSVWRIRHSVGLCKMMQSCASLMRSSAWGGWLGLNEVFGTCEDEKCVEPGDLMEGMEKQCLGNGNKACTIAFIYCSNGHYNTSLRYVVWKISFSPRLTISLTASFFIPSDWRNILRYSIEQRSEWHERQRWRSRHKAEVWKAIKGTRKKASHNEQLIVGDGSPDIR